MSTPLATKNDNTGYRFPGRHAIASSAFLLLHAAVAGCTLLNADPPMMGTVSDGFYTHPEGNFSCPTSAGLAGVQGKPRIIDARRITETEHIPLSQREPGDWKNTRIVSDTTVVSNSVRFEYASGAIVEITSGKRIHSEESVLNSGMSGGFSWRFDRRETERAKGRMMTGLLLVPWYEEGNTYMGTDIAEAYRQGQGPDPRLWVHGNIVIAERVHTVTIKLPIEPLLSPGVHLRNLSAIRDDIASRPDLRDELFVRTGNWLAHCRFSEEVN